MKRLLFLLSLSILLFWPVNVAAHVLITDEAKTRGAVLHITPDDDPIAGEAASFFFDLQGEDIVDLKAIVYDEEGNDSVLPVQITGSLASMRYTFPSQGLYKLEFQAKTPSATHIFLHSQRVLRGVTGNSLDDQRYAWAEILLIFSVIGLISLSIIVMNRREAIRLQSTF